MGPSPNPKKYVFIPILVEKILYQDVEYVKQGKVTGKTLILSGKKMNTGYSSSKTMSYSFF